MPELLRMPEVAANTTEAVLASWPVPENTPYAARDTIATVETAKAVVDVEAGSDGVILKTLVPAGAEVEIGAAIALIGTPGETVDDLDAVLADLGLAVPEAVPTQPVDARARGTAPAGPGQAAATANGGSARLFASPLARRLARQAELAIDTITGTGPNGRIVRRDVEAAIARQAAAPGQRPDPARSTGTAGARAPDEPTYTDEPHSRLRRAVAASLTGSKRSAPHFYLRGTARVDRLLKLRARLNDGEPGKVSVNDLVVKAVAHAHTLVPALNVVWTPDAIRTYRTVDVAVAVATDHGLVTPVLRSVERMTVSGVATAARDLAARARAGRLRQRELEGGTITVTNLGMFGTEEFAAIINPPQSAILAVGAARREPVVGRSGLKVGTVMRVTLSVDHRPVDGVSAAEWMRVFLSLIENPVRILA